MASQNPHRRLARLHKDLAELIDNPYPGVSVFTQDADMYELCLVLTPPSGPWKDLALHFQVTLHGNWPENPPRVRTSVTQGIEHPNLFGDYICCDLIKPRDQAYYPAGYTGGYSPALTLRGLFLQFLTFFSSTKVEQEYGGFVEIGDSYLCKYYNEEEIVDRLCGASYEEYDRRDYVQHRSQPMDKWQEAYSLLWDRSIAEPVLVSYYGSGEGAVEHTKKVTSHGVVNRLRWQNPRFASAYKAVTQWTCPKCPYGSADLPHYRFEAYGAQAPTSNPAPTDDPMDPGRCHLGVLNDDILLEIARHLQSENLIAFSQAYPRFSALAAEHHLSLRQQLQCFVLRTSLSECQLGVGIHLDPGSRNLTSDFDWLSKEAFDDHKIRLSIEKRPFGFWLPLAFNYHNFQNVRAEIWARLTVLDDAVREADAQVALNRANGGRGRGRGGRGGFGGRVGHNGAAQPAGSPFLPLRSPAEKAGVILKMMNSIVVALMKSCNDEFQGVDRADISRSWTGRRAVLLASERAIISYCHLFHLLTCLCRSEPKVLEDFTLRLRGFILSADSRIKARTPDLGELIVVLSIVMTLPSFDGKTPIAWDRIAGVLLQEAIIRNARWILQASPELEVMEDDLKRRAGEIVDPNIPVRSDYRLKTSFTASKTSLRLLMFQRTFLNAFGEAYGPDSAEGGIRRLDDNYGFPDETLPEKMVDEIKEIYKVSTWPEFFRRVQYKAGEGFTPEVFSGMLRDAMRKSEAKGYHKACSPQEYSRLVGSRRAVDVSVRQIRR